MGRDVSVRKQSMAALLGESYVAEAHVDDRWCWLALSTQDGQRGRSVQTPIYPTTDILWAETRRLAVVLEWRRRHPGGEAVYQRAMAFLQLRPKKGKRFYEGGECRLET